MKIKNKKMKKYVKQHKLMKFKKIKKVTCTNQMGFKINMKFLVYQRKKENQIS